MNIQTFHQTYIEGERCGPLDLALRGLCQPRSSAVSDKPVDFDWFSAASTDESADTREHTLGLMPWNGVSHDLGLVPWTGISNERVSSPVPTS